MSKATKWNAATWALTLVAFGFAMFLSYRQIHYSDANDLRFLKNERTNNFKKEVCYVR